MIYVVYVCKKNMFTKVNRIRLDRNSKFDKDLKFETQVNIRKGIFFLHVNMIFIL